MKTKTLTKTDKAMLYIIDKYTDEYENVTEPDNPLVKEAFEYIKKKQEARMGIGLFWNSYIVGKSREQIKNEQEDIANFVDTYVDLYAKKHNKTNDDYTIEFINYGHSQLVYVLTDDATNQKITLLVKQPIVEYGKLKQEANNLLQLSKNNSNIVAPIDYFTLENQELMVTPYINQARCIANKDNAWGMYIPEPFYRFENFTPLQEKIVTICMIAKLISCYDFEHQEGISACKLGGGDFMLPKDWEKNSPSLHSTLNNMYLISAREKINCTFDEYKALICEEFSKRTINYPQNNYKLNHGARAGIKKENIKSGIELGTILAKQKCKDGK